jgi:predicted nucleic acid-binding Zn ribbon protein
MVQTKFICKSCLKQFERFGDAGASCRKRLKQRGYVFCSKSCGAYKHGGVKNKTSEYMSWHAMKERCNNPNQQSYARYGGRGITYDPTWNNFEQFLKDMGPKNHSKLELERINNDENYCKKNCRWATHKEQTRNRGGKRATRLYTFNEKTMCIADWAKEVGITAQAMQKRLNKNWPLEKAFAKTH